MFSFSCSYSTLLWDTLEISTFKIVISKYLYNCIASRAFWLRSSVSTYITIETLDMEKYKSMLNMLYLINKNE